MCSHRSNAAGQCLVLTSLSLPLGPNRRALCGAILITFILFDHVPNDIFTKPKDYFRTLLFLVDMAEGILRHA